MQLSFKPILIGLLCLIGFVSCKDDGDVTYGAEYEINDFNVSVYNSGVYDDTIPADYFKIKLSYLSDNEYAFDYGLNPRLTSEITGLNVKLLDGYFTEEMQSPLDVSDYFLVWNKESKYDDGLYQTIDQYISDKEINTLNPYLIFTNQSSLSVSAQSLITDTINVTLQINLTLDSSDTFSKQLTAVLRP